MTIKLLYYCNISAALLNEIDDDFYGIRALLCGIRYRYRSALSLYILSKVITIKHYGLLIHENWTTNP